MKCELIGTVTSILPQNVLGFEAKFSGENTPAVLGEVPVDSDLSLLAFFGQKLKITIETIE